MELNSEDFRVPKLTSILEFDHYVACKIEELLLIVLESESDFLISFTILNFRFETEYLLLFYTLALVNLKVRSTAARRNIRDAKELNPH